MSYFQKFDNDLSTLEVSSHKILGIIYYNGLIHSIAIYIASSYVRTYILYIHADTHMILIVYVDKIYVYTRVRACIYIYTYIYIYIYIYIY